jgi:hypothetical protein
MIADSTYDVGELVGRPRAGLAAGLAAAVLMLAVLVGLQRPEAAILWLRDVGSMILPASARTPVSLVLAGLFLHLAVGGVSGALYAACQQRAPVGGLIVVGAFYGFVLWLGGDIILIRWLGVGPRLLQTWPGVLTMIAYGLVLAVWAIREQQVSARLRPSGKPID